MIISESDMWEAEMQMVMAECNAHAVKLQLMTGKRTQGWQWMRVCGRISIS